MLYNPASATLIDRVQELIDPTGDHKGIGLAPIGHMAMVRTAHIVTVNISTELTFVGGFTWEMLREQVTTLMDAYMLELRQDRENILTPLGLFENPLIIMISQVNSRILGVHGIVDIQNTQINRRADNPEINKYSIPMLGVISV